MRTAGLSVTISLFEPSVQAIVLSVLLLKQHMPEPSPSYQQSCVSMAYANANVNVDKVEGTRLLKGNELLTS